MAQTTVACPECGTEQASAYGYAPAQLVRCRRCDAAFRAPGPPRVTARVAEGDPAPSRAQWRVLGGFILLVLIGTAVVGAQMYVEAQRQRAEEAELAAEEEREEAEFRAARANRRPPAGRAADPFFNVAPPPTAKERTDGLSGRLVGVWAGDGREVEYRAEGTFRDGTLLGTWKAVGVSGTKVLKVERSAGRSPVRVTFEGDEIIHDGDGAAAVLRKK